MHSVCRDDRRAGRGQGRCAHLPCGRRSATASARAAGCGGSLATRRHRHHSRQQPRRGATALVRPPGACAGVRSARPSLGLPAQPAAGGCKQGKWHAKSLHSLKGAAGRRRQREWRRTAGQSQQCRARARARARQRAGENNARSHTSCRKEKYLLQAASAVVSRRRSRKTPE